METDPLQWIWLECQYDPLCIMWNPMEMGDGRHGQEEGHDDDCDVGDGVDDDVVWELVVRCCRRMALVGANVPVGRRNGRRHGKGAGGASSCSILKQTGFGALCGHGRKPGGAQWREEPDGVDGVANVEQHKK